MPDLLEWNLEEAKEAWFEEGCEEGLKEAREERLKQAREEGKKAVMEEIARNALMKGMPLDLIHDITGLDIAAIQNLT